MKLELSKEELYFLLDVLRTESWQLNNLDATGRSELGLGINQRLEKINEMINKLQILKVKKDCSNCNIPHVKNNYNKVLAKLKIREKREKC